MIWVADGATVLSNRLDYGAAIAAPAEDPTKAGDDNALYTFVGWTPAQDATVSSNAIYVAEFKTWAKIAVPTATTGLVYDGTTKTGVAAGTGYTLTDNTGVAASNYVATASLADPASTVWADATEVDASATADKLIAWSIAPASITITVAGTASSAPYTGIEQTGMVAYLLSSDDALYDASKVSYSGAATVAGTTVGGYAYGLDSTDFAYNDDNVTATFDVTDASFTITAATVDVPAAPANKTYNGAEQTAEVASTDTYTVVANAGGTNVGDYTVTFALTDTANYTWSDGSTTNQTFGWSITPAAVTVKADDASKKHGEADPASFTAIVSGLQGSDTEAVLSYTVSRAAGEAIGDYTITPAGDAAQGNYTVTYQTGTFTIESNEITIIWVVDGGETTNKVEWGEMPAFAGSTEKTDATGKYAYAFTGWTPEVTNATVQATYTAGYSTAIATPLALPLADPKLVSTAVDGSTATVSLDPVGTITGVDFSASPETATWSDEDATLSFSDLDWNEAVAWSVSAGQGEGALAETAYNEGKFYLKPEVPWFTATTEDLVPLSDMGDSAVGYTNANPSAEGEMVRIHTTVEIPAGGLPQAPEVGSAKSGFAVLQLEGDAAPAFYAYNGTGWVKLSGVEPEEGEADYYAAYDLGADTPTVRYYIDGKPLYVAVDGGEGVYAIPLAAGTTSLTTVAFASADMVKGDIVAEHDVSYVAAIGQTPYTNIVDAVAAQGKDPAKILALLKDGVALDPAVSLDATAEKFVVDYARGSFTNAAPAVSGVAGYQVTNIVSGTVTSYELAIKRFTVKFVDEDGSTVLKDETEYDYGTPAADIAQPATPTKAATGELVWTFAGWTPAIEPVTSNAVYAASYTSVATRATVFTVADNGDGTATTNVVGHYADLATAVAAATNGCTVLLLGDVTLDARVEPNLGAGTTLTIDLGGNTVTTTATCGNGSAFNVMSGNVTITNGSIVGVEQLAVDGNGNELKETDAITARSGANVTLSDLNVTVNSQNGACVFPFKGAHVTILSGTYANTTTVPYQYKTAWTGMAVNQDSSVTTESLVTITGGTFSQVNPMLGDDSAAEGAMSFVDPDYFAVAENGVFTVVPRIDIALADVTVADDLVYDATAKAGVVSVVSYTTNLVEGTDYVVTYADNVAAGEDTATATIVGTNLWFGTIVTNFSIAKAEATFTGASATKVYDGTALATNGFSVVGLVGGHTATATVTGSQTDVGLSSNVVSQAMVVDADENDVTANYAIAYVDGELEVTPAAMAITVAGVDATSVYTGAEQMTNVAWTATSETAGFVATNVSYAGAATVSGTDVGDYLYNLDVTKFSYADNNYAATFTLEGDGKFTITPAAITITVAGYTGIYDGAAHAASAETVPADATVLWSVDGGEFTATVPSVTGVTNVTVVAKATMANYTDATATTSLVVTAAVVDIPAAPGNKTYNGVAQTADVASADTYTVTNDGGTNVGDYTVEFALKDKANYVWSDGSTTNQTFGWSIAKAAATIVVDNASKKHGGADPEFTGTVQGLFADGDLGAVSYGRTNATEDVGVYAGVIVPTYAPNANYDVTVTPGTFAIESNEITIIWVVDGGETTNKVEWGDMPAFAGSTEKTDATGKYAYTFTGWTPEVTNATVLATYTAGYSAAIATPLALAVADPKLASTAVDALQKTATVKAGLVGAVEGVSVKLDDNTDVPVDAATATASFSDLDWNEGVEWTMTATQTAEDASNTVETAELPGKFYAKPEKAWFSATTNDFYAVNDASEAAFAYTNAVASAEGEMVRVHTRIEVPAGGLPQAPETGAAKVGFAVLQLEGDAAPAYYAFGNGVWTKLAGVAPAEGEHDYYAVYDLAAETPTARYYIDGLALYAEGEGGAKTYALPLAATTRSLSGISFASKEMVKDDVVAEHDVSYVAAVDDTPYTAIGEALAAAGTAGEKTLALLKAGVALDPAVSLGSGEKLVVDYAKGSFTNETPVVSGVAGYRVAVTPGEGSVTNYALDAIVYPIEYVLGLDGAAIADNYPTEFTVETLPVTLPGAARDGYTFNGWTNNVSGNEIAETIPVGTLGAVTNVATWTINKYLLTINYLYTNGAVAATVFTSNVVYDTAYSVASPVVEGYTADKPVVAGTMGAEPVTVDVTYTVNRYRVKFVDEDGTELKGETEYDYGTLAADIEKPEAPTKAATADKVYTFAGWTPAVEDVTSNAVYKASYSEADTKAAVITVAQDGTTNTIYVATIADAIGLAEDGDIVQLLADVSEPAVAIEDDITIDLNGNTWTVVADEGDPSATNTVAVSGAVQIVDSSGTANGGISSAAEPAVTVAQGGSLTVGEGARITTPADEPGTSVEVAAGGALVVDGIVLGDVAATGENATVEIAGQVGGNVTATGENATVEIADGTVVGGVVVSGGAEATVSGENANVGGDVSAGAGSKATVSGGTVTGKVTAENGGAVEVAGGSVVGGVSATGADSTAKVSGGEVGTGVTVANGATGTITGGSVSGNATAQGSGSRIDVSGGSVSDNVRAMNGAQATVSGTADVGRVQTAGNGSSAVVTGGHFGQDPAAYVADGFVSIPDTANGGYKVQPGKSIIGTTITVAGGAYNGSAYEIGSIVLGDYALTADDYTVVYTNVIDEATTNANDNVNAGTVIATLTGIGEWIDSTNVTFTITPAEVTVTAADKEVRRGTDPGTLVFEVSYAGFVNDETEAVLTTAATADDAANASAETYSAASPTGATFPIVAGGASAANYTFTYVEGTLTVVAGAIAAVDETEYDTIAEAVEAAGKTEDGKVITMLDDADADVALVPDDVLKIQLDGFAVTVAVDDQYAARWSLVSNTVGGVTTYTLDEIKARGLMITEFDYEGAFLVFDPGSAEDLAWASDEAYCTVVTATDLTATRWAAVSGTSKLHSVWAAETEAKVEGLDNTSDVRFFRIAVTPFELTSGDTVEFAAPAAGDGGEGGDNPEP